MNNQCGCGCQNVTTTPCTTSGFNSAFVLILVLFILLVIIGSIYLY